MALLYQPLDSRRFSVTAILIGEVALTEK
jgi:hypothetical protein